MNVRRRSPWSIRLLLASIAAMSLSGLADAAPITVVDDRGAAATFAHAPRRIVSLLPSITESVCALGACDRLVGTDRYSDYPETVRGLPKLGGLDDAQVERIVALKPDVVLAGKSARVTDRLEALGLVVVLLESETHAQVRRSLTVIARLLDAPSAAEQVWSAIERDMATAAARVPTAVRGGKVYFEIDPTPYAAGAGSFIGETLARLGMDNIAPPGLGPFPKLNPEYVVRADPDVVMAAQRALATMSGRPGWDRIDGLKRGRTCGFDARQYDVLLRPGPRLGEAALLLAECLARLPS